MEYTVEMTPDGLAFAVSGRITFADHAKEKEFKNHLKNGGGSTNCTFDLSKVEFIDSSGFGMLLALKEFAGDHGKDITLKNPQEAVSKVISACKFDEVFKVLK